MRRCWKYEEYDFINEYEMHIRGNGRLLARKKFVTQLAKDLGYSGKVIKRIGHCKNELSICQVLIEARNDPSEWR